MKKRPNFKGQGQVTKKGFAPEEESDSKEDKAKKTSRFKDWYHGDSTGVKLFRVGMAFGMAWFVLYLSNIIWFNHHTLSVNDHWDFWAKTICIFGGAAGILTVVDLVFRTDGKATAMAFSLLFCVTVARHYFPAPYYENGKPTVYVNSRTGDVYQNAYADIQHDPKSNRNYFLHPRSNDTCWNDIPKNVDISDFFKKHNSEPFVSTNPPYNPPATDKLYLVRNSPYTIILKAGQTLDHWITFEQDKEVNIEISSPDSNHDIIYSESEQYHDGPNVQIPQHDPTRFFLRAGNTDQVITLKLSTR